MAGNVATNDAGDVMVFAGGAWKPAPVAANDRGDRVFYDGSAWQPVPGPSPAAQPSAGPAADGAGGGGGMLRGLGLGVRDAIEGAAAIPGMAVDALSYPVRAAGRAMGYPMQAPTEILSGGLTAAGLPQPETPGEMLMSGGIRGAASALPTMGAGVAMQGARMLPNLANALAGGATSQIVGGLAGGAASEGARQNELGPVAQLGAGLVGGIAGAGAVTGAAAIGRGLGGMVQPFTEGGRREIAVNALLAGSAQPETLATRLAAGADPERRLPGSPVTTAQQSRDPGLLPIEMGMRSDVMSTPGQASPAARFRNIDAQRNEVRTNALLSLGDNSTPDARGAVVRGAPDIEGAGLAAAERMRRADVSRAYEAIDPEGTSRLPFGPVRAAAAEAEGRFFGAMSGPMPGNLRAALDDIGAAGDAAPWRTMQNLRQRLGEIADNPDPRNARAAAAAKQVRQSIDDTAERAALPQELPSRPVTAADIERGYAEEGAGQNPDVASRLNLGRQDLEAGAVPQAGPEGLSLVQFLRRQGGLQNQGGDVAAVMGSGRAMPGLWNNRGLTLDRAAEMAWERGFLGPDGTPYTPRDLLDAVDAELRGLQRNYRGGDMRQLRNAPASGETVADDLAREIEARGGTYDPANPEETLRSLRQVSDAPPGAGTEAPDRYAPLENAFTPDQAERWRAATAGRAEMGRDFGRDVNGATASGQILRRDPYGNPVLPDAKVATTALRSVADVRQVLRAAGAAAPEVRDQLRGQFIEDLTRQARTTAVNQRDARILAPAGFRRYLDAKGGVMAEIFEPDHLRHLHRIADDFAETSMANTVSAPRGSPTAQNLSVGNFIARASNGLIDANNPLAQTVASIGPVMRWIYAAPVSTPPEN